MTNPRCIIIGCDIAYGTATQHGDLWEVGDCYIFNAVGEPDYSGEALGKLSVAIRGSHHLNYFERRNVLIFAKSEAHLSAEATAYIARSPR